MNPLSYLFVKFAAKIIAVDDTVVPYEQLSLLHDMLKVQEIELDGKDAKKMLSALAQKHLVNDITVVKSNSRLVFSSTGNGVKEAENAVSLVKFLNGNSGKPDAISVKRDHQWSVLMPANGKLFIVKSNSHLSTVELKAITKDIEGALGERI